MKRYLLTIALIATTALGVFTSRADDTNAPAAATNAVAASCAGANAPATNCQRATWNNASNPLKPISKTAIRPLRYKDTNGNWTVNCALAAHHQHQLDQQHGAVCLLIPAPAIMPGC